MGKYKKKIGGRSYQNYSPQSLQKAINDVISKKLTYRDAEAKYGVSKSTIQRKVNEKNMLKVGRPNALSNVDEESLVNGIILSSKWGFPFTSLDIRLLVQSFLNNNGVKDPRFNGNLPGYTWAKHFINRHKSVLSERLAENIKRSRAEINPHIITQYFDNLENSLAGVLPQLIINYDETNMTDDPGKCKVITRRGSKHPERILDSSKSSVSVMFAGTASGFLLPPYVVYKAEHLYDSWLEGGPRGTRYNRSKSGWFDGVIFEDWFNKIVLPYFRKFPVDVPKAMIGDNLSSHISLSVIEECKKYNIRFILLPPNSTHLCQPLDVAFFRPLKIQWRKSLFVYKNKNRGCIPKTEFPRIFKNALDKLQIENMASKNLIAGFKATGIYPIDKNKVISKLPTIQTNLDESTSSEINGSKWCKTFEQFLSDSRSNETNNLRKNKRKKVCAQPGKSIASKADQSDEEFADIDQPSTSKCNIPNAKINTASHSKKKQHKKISVQPEEVTISGFSKDDFVTVNLLYKSNSSKDKMKTFYAQVLDIHENMTDTNEPIKLTVKYLKQSVGSKEIYIFPDVEDIGCVTADQIADIVYPVILKRNRYKFPMTIVT